MKELVQSCPEGYRLQRGCEDSEANRDALALKRMKNERLYTFLHCLMFNYIHIQFIYIDMLGNSFILNLNEVVLMFLQVIYIMYVYIYIYVYIDINMYIYI